MVRKGRRGPREAAVTLEAREEYGPAGRERDDFHLGVHPRNQSVFWLPSAWRARPGTASTGPTTESSTRASWTNSSNNHAGAAALRALAHGNAVRGVAAPYSSSSTSLTLFR